MAKNEGKQFEDDWKASYAKTPYYYMRLRDSAKWVQGQGATFTPENPCDAIQHTMPFIWLLELKSTKGASVSFYPMTPWLKPKGATGNVMIKSNQVKELMNAVKAEGVIAGFIINFRERELKTKTVPAITYFIHIVDFVEFAKRTGKSSINQEDCDEIGVVIPHSRKKVHYSYDIEEFVDRAVTRCILSRHIKTETLSKLREWIGNILGVMEVLE